ncbi:GNAT family N-acetyltransferase [Mucilaginibacter psychrotolerans]|uniref:GNAT family N-acetyltransferase n=1 Tax=Mucilaginibacter psychrotolerans TaxID=1524096 RepID=A0A4Y8SHU2_9SPHI|nr:GNAT family N-acetyltransferase [Mucilaginibacter psychrotolerans]TFF38220.1 GNAT family N-acetyltransferase [Mucilaginibacter psychrotolerans]
MQTLKAPTDRKTFDGKYRIERFNVDKLSCLSYLHMAIYGKLLPQDYFLKKYNTAFTVVTYTGFLAYDDKGLPVAFYGVIPCFIEHQGKLVLAAQSADTMTHADHRQKGLFVELAKRTYALCKKEGIRLIFGFPNQNSLPGFINRLGWQEAGALQRFTIPVKGLPLEKAAGKLKLKGLYTAYCKTAMRRRQPKNGIPNSVLAEGYGGVYRDAEFLAYKNYSDTYTLQIGHALVWFKIQNGLIVGDMSGYADNFETVMSGLQKLCRTLGLSQMQFQVNTKSKLHSLLRAYGEPIPSFVIAIKDLGSGIPPEKLTFTFADIDIF